MTGWLFFLLGVVVASLIWMAYIAYFNDDATSMGGRLRRWVKKRLRR